MTGVLLAVGLALAASRLPETPRPTPVEIKPHRPAAALLSGDFELMDSASGQWVRRSSFDGKFRLVFFGFTHCKVVCPRGTWAMGQALDLLGSDADRLVALFITTDPERDSAPVVRRFVSNFSERIIGLVGDRASIDQAMKSFRTQAEKIEIESADVYQMDHPAIFFLMGPSGNYLKTLSSYDLPADLAAQILEAMNSVQ